MWISWMDQLNVGSHWINPMTARGKEDKGGGDVVDGQLHLTCGRMNPFHFIKEKKLMTDLISSSSVQTSLFSVVVSLYQSHCT